MNCTLKANFMVLELYQYFNAKNKNAEGTIMRTPHRKLGTQQWVNTRPPSLLFRRGGQVNNCNIVKMFFNARVDKLQPVSQIWPATGLCVGGKPRTAFTFLNGWKEKSKEYFMNYIQFKFQCL